MRRQLEQRPRTKALKSLSDRTRNHRPNSSTTVGKVRPAHSKDEVRLSEFTSITTSLSDDEEDGNDDTDYTPLAEKKACPSSKQTARRRGEDDIFGTMLNKIVDHVKIGSSSPGRSSDSSNDDLANDTTEHRSNYSKRRLSIQVRRASDFLFSSHHRKDDGEEKADEHQWEVKVEDDYCVDWDL